MRKLIAALFTFLLLCLLSCCRPLFYDEYGIVYKVETFSGDKYKYIVEVSHNEKYYRTYALLTNTEYHVGDTINFVRNRK